ncbi:zinc ribbon domain-containing protein [Nostocoides australiense]|nr:C4-type zinc ribbon domain-containing protein [Tetrasphaera australiensis]HRV66551.1 C4-type zinc ribbon domain-containing protein [Candidatus Nanopelagicales bacterium]
MKADPRDQQRLLDLQQIDTTAAQLERQRSHLPVLAKLDALAQARMHAQDAVVTAETEQGDLERELAKAEADVQLVRDRAARDQAHLDSGKGTAKELTSLQHELASLARRQADLEEIEIEVMERLETAEAALTQARSTLAAVDADVADTIAERDEQTADLTGRLAEATAPRDTVVGELPADLVALYEKLRASHGGTGAAMLHARRCLGCQLELNNADIARIRAAAPDEVLRCEECSRILVRTAESGL